MTESVPERPRVILFDGVCNLCNSSVIFVLQKEKKPTFKFASIQSEAGRQLLEQCGLPPDYSQAVVLMDDKEVYLGSTAALKIGQTLRSPSSWLSTLGLMVPKLIRDWVYGQIARHRYQWFGKRDFCIVPTEDLKARFL